MKKYLIMIMATVCILSLSGCNVFNVSKTFDGIVNDIQEEKKEDISDASNTQAMDAYNSFLEDKEKVYFEEEFELPAGVYSITQLTEKLSEVNGTDYCPKYTILEVEDNGENIPILMLRMECTNITYINTVYIIKYTDGKLKATSYFNDGYRTYSTVWGNGYIEIGGGSSAGSYGYEFKKINKDGLCDSLFYYNSLSSMWVSQVEYDLGLDYNSVTDYSAMETFELTVNEMVCDEKVYISVFDYSSDSTVKKSEEEYIDKLKKLGAILVTDEELNKMISDKRYGNDMISENLIEKYDLIKCDKLYPVAAAKGTIAKGSLVQADSLDSFSYLRYSESYDLTEYVSIDFCETVSDVSYVQLVMGDNSEKFDYGHIWYIGYGGTKEPLLLGVLFEGDSPTRGIMFTDGMGDEHLMTIEISGKDGSLVMNEVTPGEELPAEYNAY